MKLNTVTFILSTTFATLVLTQGAEDPGPSPTASVGCEPHGDHWHCDGPRAAGVATTTSAAAAAAAAQDEETATPSFPPPRESVGCEAHGDHYHCAGPATGAATATGTATPTAADAAEETAEDEDEHHDGTPAFPAPTESVGCEAHGDHYHCAGPATAAQATAPPTASGAVGGANETSAGTNSTSPVPFEGAASSSHGIPAVAVTGLLGVMALVLVL